MHSRAMLFEDLNISKFEDYIKSETLSIEIIESDKLDNGYDLNGKNVKLDVERVK